MMTYSISCELSLIPMRISCTIAIYRQESILFRHDSQKASARLQGSAGAMTVIENCEYAPCRVSAQSKHLNTFGDYLSILCYSNDWVIGSFSKVVISTKSGSQVSEGPSSLCHNSNNSHDHHEVSFCSNRPSSLVPEVLQGAVPLGKRPGLHDLHFHRHCRRHFKCS